MHGSDGKLPFPDMESRRYYMVHGMLPLGAKLRDCLAVPLALEDDEREGEYRYVNPTLLCPFSFTINDNTGPFSVWRSVFQERENKSPTDWASVGALLGALESADERDTSPITRARDGGALATIVNMTSSWLRSFAQALHYDSPAPVHGIHIWSGDCVTLARRLHSASLSFDVVRARISSSSHPANVA